MHQAHDHLNTPAQIAALPFPVFPGDLRRHCRRRTGVFLSLGGRKHEAAWRWLHQAHQDDDRAHHFLYRGQRDCGYGKHEISG